jgi:S-formylglutathione hydrolase
MGVVVALNSSTVLWELDLSHEYHLVRGADHGGPTMRPRLRTMFAWLAFGTRRRWMTLPNKPPPSGCNLGCRESPPLVRPQPTRSSASFVPVSKPRMAEAAQSDPATNRRLGLLPKPELHPTRWHQTDAGWYAYMIPDG